jgi:membrane protein implicated in regulation of membrane protease activity
MNWLPLRPTALICFSTVTGGAGSIFVRLGWINPLAHAFSIASGYCLSMLIGVALPKKLRSAQNTSAAERYELIGLRAVVTSTILEGSFGKISYSVRDNTYGAPARHIDGNRVKQGANVVICEIKDNVFYVTELNI